MSLQHFTRSSAIAVYVGCLLNAHATATPITIMDIQGAGHTSPLVNTAVTTNGIVTVATRNGFYLQDRSGDGDENTSDGIFVFTRTPPDVDVGDDVEVTGIVQEYLPGGNSDNLTTTEIVPSSVVTRSMGNRLPATTIMGSSGRVPPASVIDDDRLAVFDPENDGIDFYESLEGMIVLLPKPRVTGPTNLFGEIFVVVDGASGVNDRGGVTIGRRDFNPERIQIDDMLYGVASVVQVGDVLADVRGPVTYDFGSYEVTPTVPPTVVTRADNIREITSLTGDDRHLTIATFNVHNLRAGDATHIADIATVIVSNLLAPDIVAVQEIQDNNGPTDDGTVDASATFSALIDAIRDAGGPVYDYRSIEPVNNQDGGEAGGNIRVGFLYNANRVGFADRGHAGPNDATHVVGGGSGVELTLSPGRIDPSSPAFVSARKPLAGEFEFGGEKVFVVVNHFTSRTGSDPLFGAVQPPENGGDVQRIQQAREVHSFVRDILTLDSNAKVVVLGDLNDFKFSRAFAELVGNPPILIDPARALPAAECYSYVFDGNSQALDHILVSRSLSGETDFVHINAEFTSRVSDHDPVVVRVRVVDDESITTTPPPTVLHVHPNPFNATTTIRYAIGSRGNVTLRVYDARGRSVITLVDAVRDAGSYTIDWDGHDDNRRATASGVYFVRLRAGGETLTRKAVFVK